jgi:seryl-tRNA synthetase
MTLDVLHFIHAKGGNPDEIRESQKKRGLSDEIVDEVAQMYADWVRRTHRSRFYRSPLTSLTPSQSTTRPQP